MDLGKHHPKMPRKEEVQKDVAPLVPVKDHRKGRSCKVIAHQEDTNVRQTGDLLGRGVLPDPQSLYEGKICWYL